MGSSALPLDPARRPVDIRWFVPAVGWLFALALALRFFAATQYLLLGLLGAACVASLLGPVARRIPGPRWLGALLAGLLPWLALGGAVALLSWIASRSLSEQLAGWPDVRARADRLLAELGSVVGVPTLSIAALGEQLRGTLDGGAGAKVVATGANVVTGALVSLALLFFGSIFLMAEEDGHLLGPVLALLPTDRRVQVDAAVHDLVPRLRGWLLGTMTSMTIIGVATGIGYAAVGVPLPIPLALFAGIAQIVPTFGPFAAYLVAALLAATQGTQSLLAVTAVYGLIQLLETHVITPIVMRGAVAVPPIVTLFTIVFWGHVFGLPGVLLAIPLDLTVWTFADRMLRPHESGLVAPGRA